MIISTVVSCNARSLQVPDGSIKLATLSGIPVVDGVYLNGYGPYRFLLDTGAQTNQVEAEIARKIGLVPAFQVEMATAAGTSHVAGGRVAKISLGSAKASDQEILFTTLDAAHVLSGDIRGVLGQEFLAHFDYLLDFARHRLVFEEAVPAGGNRVSFETVDGRPAIQTSEGKLVLDSGTNATLLYRSSLSRDGQTILTASGTASVSRIQNLRLRIAGHEYRSANAASIPTTSPSGDGLLPANLFHAIFVSNSGKYAIFDPTE